MPLFGFNDELVILLRLDDDYIVRADGDGFAVYFKGDAGLFSYKPSRNLS
jgi:hypothetical protein